MSAAGTNLPLELAEQIDAHLDRLRAGWLDACEAAGLDGLEARALVADVLRAASADALPRVGESRNGSGHTEASAFSSPRE